MKAGMVTALAREAPCGSAQASRTNCSFSAWTRALSSSAARRWSPVQRPCRSMNDCDILIGKPVTPDSVASTGDKSPSHAVPEDCMKRTLERLAIAALVMLAPMKAKAADIHVLTPPNMQAILTRVAPEFERASGHKLVIAYAPARAVKDKV